jgi:hypothetical protein
MNNFLSRAMLFSCFLITTVCQAQKVEKYNLIELLRDNKLVYSPNQRVNVIDDNEGQGVTITDIVFLKNITFSTGSIDVDIRGKDVFQQSFLGIAFHGIDTITYDAIYFRPFNFQSTDSLRRRHMVQYISEPKYPWDTLRKNHPLMYENGIANPPAPADWFHAHIVINRDSVIAYVNHSAVPSLKVKKLNARNGGLVGLWSSALSGDFANLEIKNDQ